MFSKNEIAVTPSDPPQPTCYVKLRTWIPYELDQGSSDPSATSRLWPNTPGICHPLEIASRDTPWWPAQENGMHSNGAHAFPHRDTDLLGFRFRGSHLAREDGRAGPPALSQSSSSTLNESPGAHTFRASHHPREQKGHQLIFFVTKNQGPYVFQLRIRRLGPPPARCSLVFRAAAGRWLNPSNL